MFKVIETLSEYNLLIDEMGNGSIGFVPTMGNLHLGHLKLLERSLEDNDISVVSIFVNPTQFGQGEDFSEYPRTREADISKLKSLYQEVQNKVMIIFIPKDSSEVYGQNIKPNYQEQELHTQLEGQLRPTHFKGVEEVVEILLRIIHPTKAYFGKKDFQQLVLIKNLVKRLKLSIKVYGIDIVREASGLAMSSRNQFLSESQMTDALIISKSLRDLKNDFQNDLDLEKLEKSIGKIKEENPSFNYIELREAKSLLPTYTNKDHLIILANYKMDKINLLDNIELN